jgi:hypothetical protein
MRKARRAQRMGAALPDALDLTVMGLESGLTFERTLATVSGELEPIERMTANVVFVLYEWPFELDPHRVVATQLATNMCLKLFERAR